MKMRKIKLFVAILCGVFSMPGLASEMRSVYITALFCVPRFGDAALVLPVYEGMPYADLDRKLKDLFRLSPDADITLKIKGDKFIEPTKHSERFLDSANFKKMLAATRVNIHYRDSKK